MPSLSRRYALNLTLLMSGSAAAALMWSGPALAGCATDSSSVLAVSGQSCTPAGTSYSTSGANAPALEADGAGASITIDNPTTISTSGQFSTGILASDFASSGQAGSMTANAAINVTTTDPSTTSVLLEGTGASISATYGGTITSAGPAIGLTSGTGQSAVFDGFTINAASGNLVGANQASGTVSVTASTVNALGLVSATSGSNVTLNVSGSTVSTSAGAIWTDATSTATVNLQNGSTWTASGDLGVGGEGTATLSVAGTGSQGPSQVSVTGDVTVGDGGIGTLAVTGGAALSAQSLTAGDSGTGDGTITIDGAKTVVTLNTAAGANPLQVGNWGVGSMTISGGATVSSTGCAQGGCYSSIGNGAGSTGTLTITGAGSSLSLPVSAPNGTNFSVGNGAVNNVGQIFGTPGGATSATLNVTAGGALNTGDAAIGQNGNLGSTNYAGNGHETITGTAVVDNATWNISSPDWSGLTLGEGSNASGSLTVRNGGAVNLGTAVAGQGVNLTLGDNWTGGVGGTGTVTVDNASIAFTSGQWDNVAVGNYRGNGSLTVQNGGSVTGAYDAEVGQDGSTGTLTIKGAGSQFVMSGANGGSGGVWMGVGVANSVAGGQGTVTVENGGLLKLDTDGNGGGGGLTLGQSNIGPDAATGTFTVTGQGSTVEIVGNNGNSGSAGGAAIGELAHGTLNLLAGGQFIVNNTSAQALETSGVAIGGDSYQVSQGLAAGVGVVNVDGQGSLLQVASANGFITTGYSGQGSLNVTNGGAVQAEGLAIARLAGSTGAVAVDGATSSITLSGKDSATGTGARVQVGAGGQGSLTLTNGASLIVNPLNANGGIFIGGVGGTYGGVGVMTVASGSQALVSGTGSVLDVGRNGAGTLNITGGSLVDIAHGAGSTGSTYVGASPFSTLGPVNGTINLAGGSTLNAGSVLQIGGGAAGNSGVVNLSGMSTINATTINVGAGGTLSGDGVINGAVVVAGGTVASDPIYINGSFTMTSGTMTFDISPNGGGGFKTDSIVFAAGDQVTISNVTIHYDFIDGATETAFENAGYSLNPDAFFEVSSFDNGGNPVGVLTPLTSDADFNQGLNGFSSDATVVTSVPEPGTWALFALGFAGLGFAGRRRRRLWIAG